VSVTEKKTSVSIDHVHGFFCYTEKRSEVHARCHGGLPKVAKIRYVTCSPFHYLEPTKLLPKCRVL
jgi:hypothetical protein